jgi:hypothetical protein
MLLLTLLTTAVLQAAPGDSLFVQASSLNLRAKPKASATIRAQVPIGSACSVVSLAKDGWGELRCAQGTGFGKLDLLGPSPPDHAQLLAQGQEPGRPLSEAMNLLQRAVTLKPSDAPTQEAFRELFWKAEFDRLVRARAANDTLKPPREPSSFPDACGDDTAACVKAALKPESDSELAWQEARVQGTDAVLAQLFADGLFHLRSGALDADQRTVTVQLESLMVPSTVVLNALGARDVQDACQPQSRGYDNSMCGFAYDQSCAPDDCFAPRESCLEQVATGCQECKNACGSTCGDCRMKCGGPNRKECVARCIETTKACEQECQEPADTGYASCEAEYKTCSEESEREWNRTCKASCDRAEACIARCQKKGTSLYTCLDRCDDRLPDSCRHRCLSGYQ